MLLLAGTLLLAAPAVRLEVSRGAGAEGCADAASLAAAVAAQLGLEPFDPAGALSARVEFSGATGRWRGVMRLADAQGTALGERELADGGARCDGLAAAVALALAVALDPWVRPALEAVSEAPSPVASPAVEAPGATPEGDTPIGVRLGFGVLGATGTSPRITVAFDLGVTVQVEPLIVGVLARGSLPSSEPVVGGAVAASVLSAALLVCGRVWLLDLCGVGSGGVVLGEGRKLSDARRITTPYAGLGARLAVDVVLAPWLVLQPFLELTGNLVTTTLEVGGQDAWRMAPLGGAAGVGFWFPVGGGDGGP